MRGKLQSNHEMCADKAIGRRRPWMEPQFIRRQRLPRVTNGIAGSFDPNGNVAAPGDVGSGGGATVRDWSDEP